MSDTEQRQTSKEAASEAGKVLQNKNSTKSQKTAAASALAQAKKKKDK